MPTLKEVFKSKSVKVNAFLSLKCIAAGNPLPQITWTLDDQLIPESREGLSLGDFVTGANEVISFINISQVRPEDGGQYACKANNLVQTAVHTARIDVFGPPVVKPMPDINAVEGFPLVIHCAYTGYPIDAIYWEHSKSHSLTCQPVCASYAPVSDARLASIGKSIALLLLCVN